MPPWLETLGQEPLGLLALVFFMAWVEYILPPLPGDTAILAGAFLAGAGALNGPAAFCAALLGGCAGCCTAYELCRWKGRVFLRRPPFRWIGRRRLRRVAILLRRHGQKILLLNRFIPGLRALFFPAAGLARVPRLRVWIAGLAGNLLWTAVLFGLGTSSGDLFEQSQGQLDAFLTMEGALVLLLGMVGLVAWLFWSRILGPVARRRKTRHIDV